MPSRLFVFGLPGVITVIEEPDVVERKIIEADQDPENEGPYVDLLHYGRVTDKIVAPDPQDPSGSAVLKIGESKDSYAPVKVKRDHIQAIRALHEEETP